MAELDAVPMDADPVSNLPSMSGIELRRLLAGLQEGVMESGDLKVTTGAGLGTSVAAGEGVVQSDAVGVYRPGKYLVANDAAVASAAMERTDSAGAVIAATFGHAANPGADPRIDLVIARVYDASIDGTTRREMKLQVVTGTAAAGATLDNRSGAPALPVSALLLADVLIAGGGPTSIPAGNIRDRRKWARGLNHNLRRVSNASAGNNYSITSTTAANIDATNMYPRIETSGPLEIELTANVQHSVAGEWLEFYPYVDGTVDTSQSRNRVLSRAGFMEELTGRFRLPVLGAGSHRVGIAARIPGSGTGLVLASATSPLDFAIRELTRQDASNS